jgi:hypothetical protein
MGLGLVGIRMVPQIRCSQTMNLYGPEVGFGIFCNQRHGEFVRELNDSPSQDRWYPFSTMTRHDRVQPRGTWSGPGGPLNKKPVFPPVKLSYL